MKAFKFLAMLIAAAALSFSATSCGDDDDDDIGGIENNDFKPTSSLKTSDNELVLTISYGKTYSTVTTAKFSNKACTSYVIKHTYSSTSLADAAWKEIKDEQEEGMKISREGNTIIMDSSEGMKGMPYEMVLSIMQAEKDAFDRSGAKTAF